MDKTHYERRSHEQGNMDKYYLLVTFGKELESDGNGNEGRRMILKDISGENTYYFGFYGHPKRMLLLFEEEVIEVIKNKLNVYSQGSSQSDFILEYDLFNDNFQDQYDTLIYGVVVNNDVPIIASNGRSPQKEVYLILDPSEAPKQEENKVLRTLATGQSDITRHEAYTKAQGLNWANASVPKYSAEATYEYVDLGLPSGTKWAKMNVGAKSETDYGLYFAWGETQGYADASTKAFSWSDYKFNPSGDGKTFTKYNTTNNKVVLDAEDDAASINMGGEWHMPTKGQCEELLNTTYITNTWVENYQNSGVNGYLFTSVSNGNTLFVPAAGRCSYGEVVGVGEQGDVLSSSLITDNVDYAWGFYFGSGGAGFDGYYRCNGLSVRGVIGNIDK